MIAAERHLHLLPAVPTESDPASTDHEDLGLAAMFLVVAALPIACAIAGVGAWSDGSLGLGTLGVVLSGRELCARLGTRCGRPLRSSSEDRPRA